MIISGFSKIPAVHTPVNYALINDGAPFVLNPVSDRSLRHGEVLAPPEYHQPALLNQEPLGRHQCCLLTNPHVDWLIDNGFFKQEPHLESLVCQAAASIPGQVGLGIDIHVFSQSSPPALSESSERLSEASVNFW